MKTQIYVCYSEAMFYSEITTQVLNWIKVAWVNSLITTTFDLRHNGSVEKFNVLADATLFIVICPFVGREDNEWLADVKLISAMIKHKERPIYAVINQQKSWNLYKANFVAGRLREITESYRPTTTE